MIEINLIPDVKQELLAAQRSRATVISLSILIGIISIAAVVILAGYVFGVQTVRSSLADRDITTKSDELSKVEDLSKTITIQNQLTKISDIHDSIKIESRIFDVLRAIIPSSPNDVQISSLAIDSDNSNISIEGQAGNSYAAVEVFKKTLDGAKLNFKDSEGIDQSVDLASNVVVGDTSYGEDSSGAKVLRFSVSFDYASELFSSMSKSMKVVISNNGDVTDSHLGVPKSLFIDKAKDTVGGN